VGVDVDAQGVVATVQPAVRTVRMKGNAGVTASGMASTYRRACPAAAG
jgi:hypothetical protein